MNSFDSGVYQPDNIIKDIYEPSPDTKHIQKLGLSPYMRVGSISTKKSKIKYRPSQKSTINKHSFSYVGPSVGASYSDSDHLVTSTAYPIALPSMYKIVRAYALDAIGYIKDTFDYYKSMSQRDLATNTAPSIFIITALLLIIYAVLIAPSSGANINPTSGSGGYNSNGPSIIDDSLSFLSPSDLLVIGLRPTMSNYQFSKYYSRASIIYSSNTAASLNTVTSNSSTTSVSTLPSKISTSSTNLSTTPVPLNTSTSSISSPVPTTSSTITTDLITNQISSSSSTVGQVVQAPSSSTSTTINQVNTSPISSTSNTATSSLPTTNIAPTVSGSSSTTSTTNNTVISPVLNSTTSSLY